jgi:hypothetical protein
MRHINEFVNKKNYMIGFTKLSSFSLHLQDIVAIKGLKIAKKLSFCFSFLEFCSFVNRRDVGNQGCHLAFKKSKSALFVLKQLCRNEMIWPFGHFLAFFILRKMVSFKASFG